MAVAFTLYSRPDCDLCEEMKAIVHSVAPDFEGTIEDIDISGDAALEAQFGHEIPVLLLNGRKAFKYRLTERELRHRLEKVT